MILQLFPKILAENRLDSLIYTPKSTFIFNNDAQLIKNQSLCLYYGLMQVSKPYATIHDDIGQMCLYYCLGNFRFILLNV
jgi:hypothetical protein